MSNDHIASGVLTVPSRPRLLLLAYACSPARGSEYAVGWNRAIEASRTCNTWVLTLDDLECRQEVQQYLHENGSVAGLHFVHVPATQLQKALQRVPGFPYHFGYQSWQKSAFAIAQEMHSRQPFDLVHHVSYCGYREPGYLWKLDAPFIWGPIGGTQNYPWKFLGQAGVTGGAIEALRSTVNYFQLRFSPRVRQAARRASVVLTANTTNQNDFDRVHGVKSIRQVETGMRAVRVRPRVRPKDLQPLRLLWSGQLYPLKGLPLLLRAMAKLPDHVKCHLRVLGVGPYRCTYERLATRLGVSDRVEWLGWRPHAEALQQLDWADAFVFTSLRDTTGTVVLEAMSAGLPVLCLDHQGVHDVITNDCGIKIPVTNPSRVISELAEAINRLASDRTHCQELGHAALDRARNYLWTAQGERMASLYRQILALSEGHGTAVSRACDSRSSAWRTKDDVTDIQPEVATR